MLVSDYPFKPNLAEQRFGEHGARTVPIRLRPSLSNGSDALREFRQYIPRRHRDSFIEPWENMTYACRVVSEFDAEALSALVHASFVGPASEGWEPRAVQVLLAEASVEALRQKLKEPAFASGAFAGRRAVGFVLMSVPSVLAMLFVHPASFRQGIGRQLWEAARSHVEVAFPQTKTVELNATRFALPFYRTVGFVPISAEFRRQGCRATRMACWLPARALGAECPMTGLPKERP